MKDEIALVGAIAVFVLCGWALISKMFKDNWPQMLGLMLVAVSCLSISWKAANLDRASTRDTLMVLGLLLYGLGTAYKVWKHRK